ncbi:MAG TPA: GIY-YIG nuclease family protein [Lutibacter sp.]|nr:GIY-YIG nuclease family protein [Lutibacter sp.]
MYFVYILHSTSFKHTYTGMTQDVDKRLFQHNLGQNKSTKAYTPWVIIHVEEFNTRDQARKREKYLKSGVGREFISDLLTSFNKAT